MNQPQENETYSRIHVEHRSPAYWQVTLDNPPLNLFDPEMFADLRRLMDVVEDSPDLRVIVVDSAVDGYFVGHIDLVRWTEVADNPYGAPYSAWPGLVTRIAHAPVITIAKVRGRARGHGNELALACDMRFASDRAVFSQLEVGLGVIPGGGGVEWLSALCGRSRALEVVVGSDDFDALTAAQYGWVNRVISDDELDGFVDRLARRIASFDPDAVRAGKAAVNSHAGVASQADREVSNRDFHSLAALSQALDKPAVSKAFGRGLQAAGDFELHLGRHLGELEPTVGDDTAALDEKPA